MVLGVRDTAFSDLDHISGVYSLGDRSVCNARRCASSRILGFRRRKYCERVGIDVVAASSV